MVFHGILSVCQNLRGTMHVPQNNGVDRVKVETVKYSKKKTHKFIKQYLGIYM